MTLSERLSARRGEIARAMLTRTSNVPATGAAAGAGYVDGLRTAISTALDFAIAALESGNESGPPVPTRLLAQARLAARAGIALDTMIRRFVVGYGVFNDYVLLEAQRAEIDTSDLLRALRTQAVRFERLISALSEEYAREEAAHGNFPRRQVQQVMRLLDGELLDIPDFAYDLDAFHVGVLGAGPGTSEAIREAAGLLECRLMLVRPDDRVAWGWLGSQRRPGPEWMRRLKSGRWRQVSLALGEPAQGLPGWRLTHREAKAAMSIAERSRAALVRYRDVALVATMLRDDLLATSLSEMYLKPLNSDPGRGPVLKETLRAYFDSEENISSAAAVLGVNRHTVASRLRTVEKLIDCSLSIRKSEIDATLRFELLADI